MRSYRSARIARWLPLITVFAIVAAACGGTADTATTAAPTVTTAAAVTTAAVETTAATETTTATETTGSGTTAAGEAYRVALIYPGTADDLSWSNAWFDGAKAAMENNPNIEVESVELLNDPAAVVQQGSAFASEGFDLILIAHGAMVEPAITLADQFPDVLVCLAPYHPTEGEEQADNLCWVDPAQHNANFLAGALAALVSETGHIASLNGFAFPGLTRQPEAFVLGARCVDPDITFTQQYIQTWTDTGIAKAAAQSEIAGGADVILAATDSAVFGVIEAAEEATDQVWVIPSYYESQSLSPEKILTSAIHGLTFTSQSIIEAAANGEIGAAEFFEFDATNNPEIDAPLYENVRGLLSEEDLATYEGIVESVRSGAITIPDETAGDNPVGTEGSGSAIDPAAIGC
jgi:basic membrane protein A and related proteins